MQLLQESAKGIGDDHLVISQTLEEAQAEYKELITLHEGYIELRDKLEAKIKSTLLEMNSMKASVLKFFTQFNEYADSIKDYKSQLTSINNSIEKVKFLIEKYEQHPIIIMR